jgi:hypothetical protein
LITGNQDKRAIANAAGMKIVRTEVAKVKKWRYGTALVLGLLVSALILWMDLSSGEIEPKGDIMSFRLRAHC